MRRFRAFLVGFVSFLALAAGSAAADQAGTFALPAKAVKHVLLISVDGLHEVDLARFIAAHPQSALAGLAAHGAHYRNAAAAMPSDSFPGLLAMITGGTPKSTGVYYDDSYDRSLSPPGSNCATKGTEIVYDESIDKNVDAPDGGGGINPAALPLDPANGCKPVYPHQFLRVNTAFEVVKAAAGAPPGPTSTPPTSRTKSSTSSAWRAAAVVWAFRAALSDGCSEWGLSALPSRRDGHSPRRCG